MKQQALYKITGMQKDVADSGMDKQHAFDLHNIRFRNNDTNTVTAIVNEAGNLKAHDKDGNSVSIKGTVIGFDVLNDTGIIFTHEEAGKHYYDVVTDIDIMSASEDTNIAPILAGPSTGFVDPDVPNDPEIPDDPNTPVNPDDPDEPEIFVDNLCSYKYKVGSDSWSLTRDFDTNIGTISCNGEAIVNVAITMFHNLDRYDTVRIRTHHGEDDQSFQVRHGSGSWCGGLTLTKEEMMSLTQDNLYEFDIKFSVDQTSAWQFFSEKITINPYLNNADVRKPSPVTISMTFKVKPESDDPEEPEEPEIIPPDPIVIDDYILDYPEELSISKCDHIYLVTVSDRVASSNLKNQRLIAAGDNVAVDVFEYFRGDLGFETKHPIESTCYFENEQVKKIYWVDGKNHLRYANIANRNGDAPWEDNLMFDSVPLLHLQEDVTITRNSTGGVFPSSTVQWCFTYLNRYGAESNIAWISPIYYSSPDDRGGKPGENCSNSFTITINKYEPFGRFDYIRLYHILRTTADGPADVRRVADVAVPVVTDTFVPIVFTDTNTTGETVDPFELTYMDKLQSVIPNTIEQKSNTMFLGNLKQEIQYMRNILQGTSVQWGNKQLSPTNVVQFSNKSGDGVGADAKSGYYNHQNQLVYNSWQITSFRRGEVYRLGFQAQDKHGKWSDVWWVGDYENTDKYPKFSDGVLQTVQASFTVGNDVVTELRDRGYRKIRPVVVYPQPWERNIYTEGLLNPTVYNVKDRSCNAPFAQSSWFIRPFPPIDIASFNQTNADYDGFGNKIGTATVDTNESVSCLCPYPEFPEFSGTTLKSLFIDDIHVHNSYASFTMNYGSWAEYRHDHPLGDSQQHNGEIQCMYNPRPGYDGIVGLKALHYDLTFPYCGNDETNKRHFVNGFADFFYVDQSILTMNSADIQFDEKLLTQKLDDYSLRITGIIPITSFIASYDILTNTPPNKFRDMAHEDSSLFMPQGFYSTETVGARLEDFGFGWKSMISAAIWHDEFSYESVDNENGGNTDYVNTHHIPVGFAVYPWHGMGSLNNDSIGTKTSYSEDDTEDSSHRTGNNYISGELKTKILANLHYSYNTFVLKDLSYSNLLSVKAGIVLDEQQVALTRLTEPENSGLGVIHYFGSVDKLITPSISVASTQSIIIANGEDDNTSNDVTEFYDQYPLSRAGGYPRMAAYYPLVDKACSDPDVGHITFNSPYTPIEVFNTLTGDTYDRTYEWMTFKKGSGKSMASIPIKYKSCNHLVLAFDYVKASGDYYQPCLTWGGGNYNKHGSGGGVTRKAFPSTPFWNTAAVGDIRAHLFTEALSSSLFDDLTVQVYNGVDMGYDGLMFGGLHSERQYCGYLFMGQLCRNDEVPNRFGGDSYEAIEQNVWIPAGEAVYLRAGVSAQLVWSAGDTYYQRYDALRTYPYTEDDVNKVIDIVSFMTETHTNIDGRYDRNRGLSNNNHCRPTNFNLMNYVYTQNDNFFTYHSLNPDKVNLDVFEYSFTWTLPKVAGALRDEWSRITLATTHNCDGNKGTLNRIVRLDNSLVAFQSGGVAQILFNENVQIQASEGLPIELANSGKLQGLRYYTTEAGCQNKWSIAVMPNGIYWIDGRTNEFYMLGEGVTQLGQTKLMSTWFRGVGNLDQVWNPGTWEGFYTHKDAITGELFITGGDVCLCYDTLLGEFTSFYDYYQTNAMFSLCGHTITVAKTRGMSGQDSMTLNDNLWLHRKNLKESCKFYNKQYPFWVEVVCNGNNQGSDYGLDKVFDNLSWRADAWRWFIDHSNKAWQYKPFVTFTDLSGRTDYQKFEKRFDAVSGTGDKQLSHPNMPINLRKKFKVWYTTIPRALDADGNEARDRIRDTWCHITLTADTTVSHFRHVFHDLIVTYFIP